MARARADLPAGIRLRDRIGLGVIAKPFPLDRGPQVLADTGKARERDLPAHVMVSWALVHDQASCCASGWSSGVR